MYFIAFRPKDLLNTNCLVSVGTAPPMARDVRRRVSVRVRCRINVLLPFLFCNVLARPCGLVQRALNLESKATSCLGGLLTQGNLSIVGMGFPDGTLSVQTKIICHFSKLWWVLPDPLASLSSFSFFSLASLHPS